MVSLHTLAKSTVHSVVMSATLKLLPATNSWSASWVSNY